MKQMEHVATSRTGFIQQIVSGWVRNGYYFYVKGEIPAGKDPAKLDEKFLFQYPVSMSSGQRFSRKKRGVANLAYLRHERNWIMLSTRGRFEAGGGYLDWRAAEGQNIRNCKNGRQPIQFYGYSIYYVQGGYVLNRDKLNPDGPAERDRKYRVRVQISRAALKELKAKFLDNARCRREEWFAEEFWKLPYEPYAPVRQQLLEVLRQVNASRSAVGMSKLSPEIIRYRREPVKVFE